MADNFKNTHKSVKIANSSKHIQIKRQRKKKHSTKRKNNQYFKRKRLLRSTIFRKKKLKMNSVSTSTDSPSANRWQDEDSIEFWKARAISFEFENKMLHKHIKQMYVSMIPHNQELLQQDDEADYEQNQELQEDKTKVKKYKEKLKKEENLEDEEASKPPLEQISKKREEEMKILYGSAWRTIIGMETAVQVNYDVTIEKNKSKYWPVVPIKL